MDVILLLIIAAVFWGFPGYLVHRANRAPRAVTARWAIACAGVGLSFIVVAIFCRLAFSPTAAELVEPLAYAGSFVGPWLGYVMFLRLHPPKRINDPRIRTNEFVAEHPGQPPTYALAVNISTSGASDLAEQIKLVGVEALHWKNMRGSACERIMFVLISSKRAHPELKQALAAARASEVWPGPFMRQVAVAVALLDQDGTPVEDYQLVGA